MEHDKHFKYLVSYVFRFGLKKLNQQGKCQSIVQQLKKITYISVFTIIFLRHCMTDEA